MNETTKNIGIILLIIFLLIASICAVNAYRDVGRLRQATTELEERNRQLELANNQYVQQLDSIADRVTDAQDAARRAGDTISKIRAIVDAIDAISQELRKPIEISKP